MSRLYENFIRHQNKWVVQQQCASWFNLIVTARKRSSGKVTYSQVSVCTTGVVHPDAPQGRMNPGSTSLPGWMHSRPRILTVKMRVIRILLEFVLVLTINHDACKSGESGILLNLLYWLSSRYMKWSYWSTNWPFTILMAHDLDD